MKFTKADLIFETKNWQVFLTPDQTYIGRGYVSLKREAGSLSELTQEEVIDFFELVKKFESALKQVFDATMFNWTCLMNNAYKEKPYNPHVHFHVRPRYDKEVEFAGEIFADPNFAEHYKRGIMNKVSDEVRKQIIDKIKDNI